MKTSFVSIISTIIIALIVSMAVNRFMAPPRAPALSLAAEPTYERIKKSGVIRCGYFLWPPFLMKDPNTGIMSGVVPDYIEQLAKGLNLRVEWKEEIGLADFAAALDTGRVDVICGPITAASQRIAQAYFTDPIVYAEFRAYSRAGDSRFDGNLAAIDSPDVTISTMEGELSGIIARRTFPKAKVLEITSMQGPVQIMMNVATKKADICFMDPQSGQDFIKNNPGSLKEVAAKEPYIIVGASFAIKMGEDKFLQMMNKSGQELYNTGFIQKLLRKYGVSEQDIYLPAKLYRAPNS
ncbi:MAG: substrate-binding periplasmic protein [Dongiaceae bacterium]